MEIGQRAGSESERSGRGCASGIGGRAGGAWPALYSRKGLFWKGFYEHLKILGEKSRGRNWLLGVKSCLARNWVVRVASGTAGPDRRFVGGWLSHVMLGQYIVTHSVSEDCGSRCVGHRLLPFGRSAGLAIHLRAQQGGVPSFGRSQRQGDACAG